VTRDRFPCPCCGYCTLSREAPGTFEICEVCYWQDDPIQFERRDYRGGANQVSLNEARDNFAAFGATDDASRPHVRPPRDEERC
jgi:hypothetical protein